MNSRLLTDILRTILDSILSHKLRAALTLTGVIVGTGTVALVGAILTGLVQRAADVTEKNSLNVMYLTKGNRIGSSFEEPTSEERQRKDFTYADVPRRRRARISISRFAAENSRRYTVRRRILRK